MNYRHIYHAGNLVDVIKHSVLTLILQHLRKKEAPFCYIDTHAGAGIYDLTSAEAEKTGEAVAGVQHFLQSHPSKNFQAYIEILKSYQTNHVLHAYPGSPLIARRLLRPQDSMILNEYHPEILQSLRSCFTGESQVAIHQRDAYEFLPAILPPRIPRGVVLIDPPFEQKDEHAKMQTMLQKTLKKWAHGIYLIWYPVTTRQRWDLPALAQRCGCEHYLIAELTIAPAKTAKEGLIGCQLLIVNPPWQLQETLQPLLKFLWEIFNVDRQGGFSVNKK